MVYTVVKYNFVKFNHVSEIYRKLDIVSLVYCNVFQTHLVTSSSLNASCAYDDVFFM